MAFSVKDLRVDIDFINDSNSFRNGDLVSGRVSVELRRESVIDSLSVKAKGKASVLWSESHGKNNVTVYYDKETCFKSLHFFIQEQKNQEQDGYALLTNESGQSYPRVVMPGIHVYPFSFQIPHQAMPASFKGCHGKVVYFLEAKLCMRKWKSKKAKVHFNYVPQGDMSTPGLLDPQHGNKEKMMRFFTSGNVSMKAEISKLGYHPGEELQVSLEVANNSTRLVKPKFVLYQKQSFFAGKKRKLHLKDIVKKEGEPIQPSTTQTVKNVLQIPTDVSISILNCRVLKVEYRLKVCLKMKFASDLEIKLPVELLHLPEETETDAVASTDTCTEFDLWTSQASECNKLLPELNTDKCSSKA